MTFCRIRGSVESFHAIDLILLSKVENNGFLKLKALVSEE